jgi:hypothetical protein
LAVWLVNDWAGQWVGQLFCGLVVYFVGWLIFVGWLVSRFVDLWVSQLVSWWVGRLIGLLVSLKF